MASNDKTVFNASINGERVYECTTQKKTFFNHIL